MLLTERVENIGYIFCHITYLIDQNTNLSSTTHLTPVQNHDVRVILLRLLRKEPFVLQVYIPST